MIGFSFYSHEFNNLPLEELEKAIPQIITQEGKEQGDITVIFCTDEDILVLNQEHLSHDFYTDIITFDYSNDAYMSGDLFISIDRVMENAAEHRVSMEHELHRVVFHGVLHLLGYNDKTEEQIAVMRSKENAYLTQLFHVKHDGFAC